MKSELATAIVAAIAGVLLSYFVTGLFTGEIEPVGVKTVEDGVTIDLAEPDSEIFNYKALNPTVEIYIGNDDTPSPENQDNETPEDQEDNQENF